MKGLELSQQYYEEYAKEIFHKNFGTLMDRVAIGLVGPGSECFGFDDEYSRDHDWGPYFYMWLNNEDYNLFHIELSKCYTSLQKEFKGFGPKVVTLGEEHREGVHTIGSFYKRYTGLEAPPKSLSEWRISPSNLALCTNGRIFSDPLGIFTDWREHLLNYYPNEVTLEMIANSLFIAGQAGQYNWQRAYFRKSTYAKNVSLIQFTTEICKLLYIINKRFSPYSKWLHRGLLELPIQGRTTYLLINRLLEQNDSFEEQQVIIHKLTEIICSELFSQGHISNPNDFLVDISINLKQRLKDERPTYKRDSQV